ncbi:hypothetical protein [Staphylococcus chromogenes]
MAKIKTKKYMNLAELIKWAGENRIKNKKFIGSSGGGIYFYFDENSWISIDEPNLIEPEETFEVEVEEEITEETVIPDLIELFEHTGGIDAIAHSNASIHQIIRGADEDAMSAVSFYILNDDMTMTLLWKNGEMVE